MRDFLPGQGAYGFAFTAARISDDIVIGAFFLELQLKAVDIGGTPYFNTYRFTSAPVDIITYSGTYPNQTSVTWTGGGELLEISAITETTSLQANGCVVKFSGIDNSVVGIAVANSAYQGGIAKIMYGPYQIKVQENITEGSSNISTTTDGRPPIFFEGILDTMQVVDSGETSTITLNIESPLSTFDRSKPNRYTHENQRGRSYSGYFNFVIDEDHALAHVVDVQRKVLKWGV